MKTVGIVAEYNPFHLGHEYHIKKTREMLGEECAVICAMSGDFVQRGEAAMYSKFARAEAAVSAGVDLVVELPTPWALSSAEGFARGGVALLAACGAEYLSFGSESGELASLKTLADALCDDELNASVRELLNANANLSYAVARQLAVESRLGALAALLEKPNNILAVEYLKAINMLSLNITPLTVCRAGAGHDVQNDEDSALPSAMDIRRRILRGDDVVRFIPPAAYAVYSAERDKGRTRADEDAMELAILSRLRMLPREAFLALPDADGGAGERLYAAARSEPTLDAVLSAAKTKRYALSRLRRMCMCAALGITADMSLGTPPYIRVLAATERGCAVLRTLKDRKAGIPAITKPASVSALDDNCRRVFAVGVSAHDLFALSFRAKQERKGGEDWRISPKIVKNS